MSSIAYRLTVYGTNADGTDAATALTPIAGAVHSDSFKVASISGVTGFAQYLGRVTGRRGRLDVLTKRVDTGALTIRLVDARTTAGGTNLERWVTAFIGDTKGRNRLHGRKVLVEESTDGGSTWDSYFTGRIRTTRLAQSRIWFELDVRDMRDLLDVDCYVGKPHSSIAYASMGALLPAGLTDSYGSYPTLGTLSGTVRSWGAGSYIELTRSGTAYQRAILTEPAFGAILAGSSIAEGFALELRVNRRVRVRLTRSDTSATGDFYLKDHPVGTGYSPHGVLMPANWFMGLSRDSGKVRPRTIGVVAVDADDPAYLAMPPAGTAVTFDVVSDEAPTPDAPLVIDDVHVAQHIKDLLDGKFGRLAEDGTVLRSFSYDSSAFTTLIADPTLPLVRDIVTRTEKLKDRIERLCAQAHLGYYFDADGVFVPFKLWLPSSSPTATTIGNDDVVEDEAPTWEHGADGAVTVFEVRYYMDRERPPTDITDSDAEFPPVPPSRIESEDVPVFPEPDFTNIRTYGAHRHTIDATGLRTFPRETLNGVGREDYLRGYIARLAAELRGPFGTGPMVARLPCRRTANTTGVQPGTWRIIDVDALPDPAGNVRGGSRLMLCTAREERGPKLYLDFLDAGPDSVAVAPSIGTPTQSATLPKHAVDVSVTLNASSEPAVVEYAITDTATAVRPAETSAKWTRLNTVITATGSVTIGKLPSNSRVWVRTRTEVRAVDSPKLPSAWAHPSATGYVDTEAITAPSSLSDTVDGRTGTGTWTVGDADYPVMPVLSGSDHRTRPLPPGSTRYAFEGLDPSTAYTWGVKHVDDYGGESATTTDTFTTGTSNTLVAPRNTTILQGASSAVTKELIEETDGEGFGLEVGWGVTEPHAVTQIQVDTDSAFGSADQDFEVAPGVGRARIQLPLDGTLRYVRLRHKRDGWTESDWDSTVSAYPTVLGRGTRDGQPFGFANLSVDAAGVVTIVLGSADPDSDRAYYEVSTSAFPTVTTGDSSVERASFGEVDPSVTITAGQTAYLTVRFYNIKTGVLGPAVQDKAAIPGSDPTSAIALNNFTEKRSGTDVVYTWTRGSSVEEVWVHVLQYDAASLPSNPWPDTSDLPVSVLTSGTDTYTVTYPPPGYVTYVQFEPRSLDDGTVGPLERDVVTSTIVPPDYIVNLALLLDHDTGGVTVRVEADNRTGSWRYAYNVGANPSWPTDGDVEAGTVRTISSTDTLTLASGTVGLGQKIRFRAIPYLNADGTGTDGATDHGEAWDAEAERVKLRHPTLTATTVSESSSTGTFGVTPSDPDGLATSLYYRTKSGTGSPTAWTLKTSTPTEIEYQETVTLVEDHPSWVEFELRGTVGGEDYTFPLKSPAFDRGQIPQGVIAPFVDRWGRVSCSGEGDFDTASWRFKGYRLADYPGDATATTETRAASVVNGRVVRPGDVGTLRRAQPGETVVVTALAYSATAGGGNESSALMKAEITFKGEGVPGVAEVLNLTLSEPTANVLRIDIEPDIDTARGWTYEKLGGWPTVDGTQTGLLDEDYRHEAFDGRRTVMEHAAEDGTWYVIAVPENAAGVEGIRSEASLAIDGTVDGSEGRLSNVRATWNAAADAFDLTWDHNAAIESGAGRWLVDISRNRTSIVTGRDARTDISGTTANQGGYQDTTPVGTTKATADAGGDSYWQPFFYTVTLRDNNAVYADKVYHTKATRWAANDSNLIPA